ncbi:hypothetical protein A2U01_0019836, partial [Trifolium medium]|nr:hypothetical protein [Trifolium medium]
MVLREELHEEEEVVAVADSIPLKNQDI